MIVVIHEWIYAQLGNMLILVFSSVKSDFKTAKNVLVQQFAQHVQLGSSFQTVHVLIHVPATSSTLVQVFVKHVMRHAPHACQLLKTSALAALMGGYAATIRDRLLIDFVTSNRKRTPLLRYKKRANKPHRRIK